MSWGERRRALGRVLDRVGLKRPLNHLRFTIQRPPWWLEQRARRRFFRRWIRRGSLCFDVGANDGRSAALFLDLGARVVSVEPQPACVEQARAKLGSEARWTLVPTALGEAEGSVLLHETDSESQIASVEPAWIEAVRRSGRFAEHQWNRRREVPVRTLDSLIAEYGLPDFCKIDVEGAEPAVLRGLSQPLPSLSFEWTPEFDTLDACLHRLEGLAECRYQFARHDEWRSLLPAPCSATELRRVLGADPERLGGGDVYAFALDSRCPSSAGDAR